jgi:alpha-ribazole phosphatase
MTHLYLIRHAETQGTGRYHGQRSDPTLSDIGRSQALALAKRLAEEGFLAIYTSPLERTRQTAEAIAKHHSCPIETLDDLSEMDFGRWDGLSYEEINTLDAESYGKWLDDPLNFSPPGGEDLNRFHGRIKGAFDSIIARHSEGSVAAVSHGGAIRVMLCEALGLPMTSFWCFRVEQASITVLEVVEPRTFFLDLHNDRCHLRSPDHKGNERD